VGQQVTESRSYYGRPIIKEPVWKPEIPWYFFCGGLAGASAGLAFAARLTGNRRLARTAQLFALAGVSASPPLLIADLGRPMRFYNMFRVFKVTSPMSVGSWILGAAGTSIAAGAGLELLQVFPRLQLLAGAASGTLGMPLATYTGALLADTSVPVWHEARRDLPFVFAASSAASAGAASSIFTASGDSGPARRLAVLGGAAELLATRRMERRLGTFLAEPYHEGQSGAFAKTAKTLTAAGTVTMALLGRRRAGAVAGGALLLGGAVYQRWAVFKAGFASARNPKYTVVPQRRRVEERARP
jgi:polysulfide reductase-like protein